MINISVNIYLFKVNNRVPRKKCEIYSKLTIKTPERRQRHRSGVFIAYFRHISHHFLSTVSFVDFEQVSVCWDIGPHIFHATDLLFFTSSGEIKFKYVNLFQTNVPILYT